MLWSSQLRSLGQQGKFQKEELPEHVIARPAHDRGSQQQALAGTPCRLRRRKQCSPAASPLRPSGQRSLGPKHALLTTT